MPSKFIGRSTTRRLVPRFLPNPPKRRIAHPPCHSQRPMDLAAWELTRRLPRPTELSTPEYFLRRMPDCVSLTCRCRGVSRPTRIRPNCTLNQCEKKRPRILDWPWDRPRMGMKGILSRALPLIEFRTAYAKTYVSKPRFASRRRIHTWGLGSAQPPHT